MGATTFYLLEQERKARETATRERSEKEEAKKTDITKLTVKEAIKLVEECNDKERLKKWLSEEAKGENRKTLIEPLEEKISELEGEE